MSRKKMHRDEKKSSTSNPKSSPYENRKQRAILVKTLERQERFLKAYESLGNRNMTAACKVAGITNAAVYRWIRTYPKFAGKMLMIDEGVTDMVESKLIKRIKENEDKDCIMFYLRTKGRNRGYAEKQTIEAEITHRLPQDRIDAIVRAHEHIVLNNKNIPDSVIKHLERGKEMEKSRLLSEHAGSDSSCQE